MHRLALSCVVALLFGCPSPVTEEVSPPTVEAGPEQEVDEGAAVTLQGTATDHEGATDGFAWAWTVQAGPDVELAGADSAEATFTAPGVGEDRLIVLALTATDADGRSGSDVTTVLVRSLNLPPTVDSGASQVVDEGAAAALSGSAEDEDGEVASLLWTQLDGPEVALDDPTAGAPAFTAPTLTERADLLFELVATDDDGAEGRDTTVVTVLPLNAPPTVEAGEDQLVDEQTSVQLSAVADDADGTVASVGWTQLGGAAVTLDDPAIEDPTFVAPTVTSTEVLTLQVVATDNEGATSSDVLQITVQPVNAPPVADAGPAQQVDEGVTVDLTGGATDDDGVVAASAWSQLSGPVAALDDPTELATSFEAPTVTSTAVLVFQLLVIDDEGAVDTDLCIVVVLPVNETPQVHAGLDQSVAGGASVALLGTASDPDGSVATLAWVQSSGTPVTLTGDDTLGPTFTAPDVLLTELLTFTLTATDDEGAFASDDVAVTVDPLVPINEPPTAYAGADQLVGSSSTVQLAGAGADPDGVIASSTWTQLEGPTVALSDPSLLDPTFTAASTGCALRLVFELTVVDDGGAEDTDTMAVVVQGSSGGSIGLAELLSLDGDDGGLIADGGAWEYGVPTSGPGLAHEGTQVWATNLAGNAPGNDQSWLCMPLVDRGTEPSTTLSLRLWTAAGSGDGVQVQALDPSAGWTALIPDQPDYDATSADGPVWRTHGYHSEYVLALVPLPAWGGAELPLRFSFRSDGIYQGPGAYLDELRVDSEGSDPDGDGLLGLMDELAAWGTDPLVFDTDGDSYGDGDEVTAGTDPLDPADFPGVVMLVPGDLLDFEGDDGGLATNRTVWQHGVPVSGPGAAYSGSQAWATNLSGNPLANASEALHLPPVDLTGATDPTLTFRLYANTSTGDGVRLELLEPTGEWATVVPDRPEYDATIAGGGLGWRQQRYLSDWTWAAASLAPWAGEIVQLRLLYRSDGIYMGPGVYIDDLGLFEESDDPDGDGLVGILDEWLTWGTDPMTADTDGDGSSDGDELAAATDPLLPADLPGGLMLLPGDLLDFEGDDGGLATTGTLWAAGEPTAGPADAWSGVRVWATDPTGGYFGSARETLDLPPIDLTAATDPSLGFRLWVACGSGDGVSVEIQDPVIGWTPLEPEASVYDGSDAIGADAWRDVNYRDEWAYAALSLAPWVGEVVHVRLVFRSDSIYGGTGGYIDDLVIWEEADDLDGDGLPGLITERLAAGSDPDVADTDGDGDDDGAEAAAGTDPLDPAWGPGLLQLLPGELLDLELDDGGLASTRFDWQYGAAASGPGAGHTGSRVWATNLAGWYSGSAIEPLHLPALDLAGAADPTLSLRLWIRGGANADALTLQVKDPALGWAHVEVDLPVYDSTDLSGEAAWVTQGEEDGTFVLAALNLADRVGGPVQVRLLFRSDGIYGNNGAYIDDVALDEESSDPDGDGLLGVLDEVEGWGTDPYAADTDGDGVDDGVEVAAGTDPLDAGDF